MLAVGMDPADGSLHVCIRNGEAQIVKRIPLKMEHKILFETFKAGVLNYL
jgi:hypothetical protein